MRDSWVIPRKERFVTDLYKRLFGTEKANLSVITFSPPHRADSEQISRLCETIQQGYQPESKRYSTGFHSIKQHHLSGNSQ